jgi:hypothetical protein
MNKYEMIQQAYRWREMKRQQSNEELYKQIYYVFFFILALNSLSIIYKNYNYINTPYNNKLAEGWANNIDLD